MSVGCLTAPVPGSTSSTDCEDPPRTALAGWDEVTAGGVSVRDHIGFGLGTFAGPLAWVDSDPSTYALVLREGRAWVSDAPGCSTLLVGEVDWTLTSDDGRLDQRETYEWIYDVSGSPVRVAIDGTPTFDDVEIVPQDAASTLQLRLTVHVAGESTVALREDLPIDSVTTRVCIHAYSGDPAELGCADYEIFGNE